ncbi:MAG: cation:proton antiporter [Candidatus Altiarchaeota archaeon]|nr:cation:proton antiporter [Candidatus Altiarchaeota archaeon]
MIEPLLSLALLLILAKIFGEFCERLGIPSILGELSAGIILGPALFGFVHPEDPAFSLLAEVGIIMLLFVAGFEHVDIKSMLSNKSASITMSLLRSFVPLFFVTFWAISTGYPFPTALMLGIALGATSMGVTVRSLLDCNHLNTRAGKTIIGTLIINDITGLLLLTLVVGVLTTGSGNMLADIAFVFGGIFVFFFIFFVAEKLFPFLMAYSVRLRVEEAQFTLVFVMALLIAFLAKNFGLSTMIGAFFAGIALSRSSILETETFAHKLSSISYGIFIPIFFAVTGAMINLGNIFESGLLAITMLLVLIPIHLCVAVVVGRLFHYSKWESLIMGFGLVPSGEVTLIVMTSLLALTRNDVLTFGGALGLKGVETLFSAALLLIAMTILIAPTMMKLIGKRIEKERRA